MKRHQDFFYPKIMRLFKLNKELIIREDDKKLLIQQTGNVVQLDKFGLFVVKILLDNGNIDALLEAVKDSFDTSELTNDQLKEWVMDFLIECQTLEIGSFE